MRCPKKGVSLYSKKNLGLKKEKRGGTADVSSHNSRQRLGRIFFVDEAAGQRPAPVKKNVSINVREVKF